MENYSEELVFTPFKSKLGEGVDFDYSRYGSGPTGDLESAIRSKYGLTKDENSDLSPSGMGAIASVFHALVALYGAGYQELDGLSIILDQELYVDTPKLVEYIRTLHVDKIVIEVCDCADPKALLEAAKGAYKRHPKWKIVVFAESCSNPTGRLLCFENLEEIKNKYREKLMYIVDNTWTTALGVNPFKYGVDVVVESLTKYVSGGRVIGGVVLSSNKRIMQAVRNWHAYNGIHVSAGNVKATLAGMQDMEARLDASSKATLELLKALLKRGIEVIHPFVSGNEVLDKHDVLLLPPSLFVVWSKFLTKQRLREKTLATGMLEFKTSYGGPHSRIHPFSKKDEKADLTRIRVAVGYLPFDVEKMADAIQSVIEK